MACARCSCHASLAPSARAAAARRAPRAPGARRRGAPLAPRAAGEDDANKETISKLDALLDPPAPAAEAAAPAAEQGAEQGGGDLYVDDDEMEAQKDNVSDAMKERMRREIIGLGGSETEKTDGNPFLTAIIGGGLIIVLGALVTGTL